MTETNLVPIILGTGGTLLAAIVAATGVLALMVRSMHASLNQRFDDAQRANDDAHAGITENIQRVERQQEKGLDRLYGLLSATLPRAAAEQPPTNTPRA